MRAGESDHIPSSTSCGEWVHKAGGGDRDLCRAASGTDQDRVCTRHVKKRTVVARLGTLEFPSVHYLEDGRAGYLRVVLLEQQRFVRRPLHDTVEAVGRECG